MEIAKWLIAFVAVFNFGGLVADGIVPATARQHIRNPHWPPHAKFHNAQTMLMGISSGLLSLSVLFSKPVLTLPAVFLAAGIAVSYFAAMALAPMFPGTAWTDPEFTEQRGLPLSLAPQQLMSYCLCGVVVIAVCLAVYSR